MPKTNPPADTRKPASKSLVGAKAAARNTDSGAAEISPDSGDDAYVEKLIQTDVLVAAMPFNATKSAEHGFANAISPKPGATANPSRGSRPAARCLSRTAMTNLAVSRRRA